MKRTETLCAPQEGIVVPLASVGRKKETGRGFAVDGERGDIVSPVNGTVTGILPGMGRISIRTPGGMDVRLQIGTGEKNFPGMLHVYAKQGDAVRVGERLFYADLDRVRRLGGETECVVTVGNPDRALSIRETREPGGTVRAGTSPVLSLTLKN